MTGTERKTEQHLARAHDSAWNAGRFDVCVWVIAALNTLPRYLVRPVPDNRNEDERDLAEEVDAAGLTMRNLINNTCK